MDERLVQTLDVTIDALVKRKATEQDATKTLRAIIRREPRQWDSADISYEEPA
jgi:hypothetical protein